MLTHNPFQPTPDSADWDPKAMGEGVNQDVKHFADMTAYMDKLVGSVDAKLAELGIRDNTLLLFLGDNGTLGGVTSRFRGTDFRGGKGTTTHRGTHVPCIASWPAVIKEGRALGDLISSVDFLPTICQAAGIAAPAKIDGVSFLPRLRGEAGHPRQWLYSWYSPRQGADMTVREFAFNDQYKLYRDGRLFDLASDPDEKSPLAAAQLDAQARTAAAMLQKALDQFTNARPAELDRAFEKSVAEQPAKAKKNKKKK